MRPSAKDQARKSFLLLTPFPYNDGERYNINVDAVDYSAIQRWFSGGTP